MCVTQIGEIRSSFKNCLRLSFRPWLFLSGGKLLLVISVQIFGNLLKSVVIFRNLWESLVVI